MGNPIYLQAMLNKAHIKLNAKKLYAADGHAVKVRGREGQELRTEMHECLYVLFH